MDGIHRLAKMFEALAEHSSKITGEQAERINDYLMFNEGIGGVSHALEREDLKLGPQEDKGVYFILDSDGLFVINAFVEKFIDRGAKKETYKVRPKDMRGLIKEYETVDEKDGTDFVNTMESYKRWDDGLE